ncbi:unnamed protein product [Tilletia controversa]|uniref:AB hydrolase-1 domain-containing protein n=3 Tax=Tilletia TaxID=13289 RepID=A0A8X7MW16_9BASI|nr:hypothetical protein CF336_g4031 [Tilletia laevis]KAE8197879.1 hypothetical protein CF328_g3720 [Tilletia controversa]KAE8259263.1 hypothetical protein A4X03_0g4145 [Tilletia caries]KAE8200180.1 hypothetical protein CF335_g4011 [Tilletia laevis]KAE8251495.1 hypothetical protein A4X06_0g2656 [Tilletia controversa]
MVVKGKHSTADGAQIAYELHGEHHLTKPNCPTPLILIMGLSGDMPMWHPFAPALGATRPTLIFDHRGIGLSKIPEEYDIFELSFDVMVDDMLSLVRSFEWGSKDVHLLGYSMGGHILMHLLTREDGKYEEGRGRLTIGGVRITKAVLAATMTKLPRGDFSTAEVQEIMGKHEDKKTRDQAVTEYMIDMQYYPEWLAASPSNAKIRNDRIALSLQTKPPQATIMAQMQAISSTDVRPVLPRIPSSFPVLILHGKRDRMVAFQETEYTRKGIGHAETLFLEDVGHFWYDMHGGAEFWVGKLGGWLDQENGGRARL